MTAFKLSQGNLPLLLDTLTDDTGAAVDLTGATVALVFQLLPTGASYAPAATVTDAPNGKVQYQFVAPQTNVAGIYQGQWRVTDTGGGVRTFPTCAFTFEIEPGLPFAASTQFTRLADLYDDVRALTGDFKKQIYEDSAIASVMRSILRQGKVRTDCAGWALGADGLTISPAIQNTDTLAYSLLVYHAALTLVTPNLAAYSYRTRSLSEHFGEQKDFLFELKNALYEMENDQAWANITGLRSWLFAVNGIFVWSYLQAQNNINLSYR